MGINLDRKLLALVAADMVGFSRLIESNEIQILQRQKQHLIKVIEPSINKYKGKTPFILSGGIGPEDAALIAQVDHPMFAGVDLNSRFESEPGIKNTDSLNQFFTALKNQKSYDLFNR